MRKNPAERYSSAAEMRDDLKRVAGGQSAIGGAYTSSAMSGQTSVLPPVENAAAPRSASAPQIRPVPQRRVSPWVWVAVVVALLALGLGAAWALNVFGGGGVIVPTLTGLTEEQAKTELTTAGLAVGEITTENSDSVALGLIIRQDPEAGAEVEEGAAVNIVVSIGIAQVTVPDFTSMPEATAIEALRDAASGLDYNKSNDEFSAEIAKGLVIRTEPALGTAVPKGTRVTLFVSAGVEQTKVPDVIGKTLAQADALIKGVGLVVATTESFSDTVAKGSVISQSPAPNVVYESGSTVTLEISKGPEIIIVPEVRTKTEADARAIIEAAGLKPKVVYVDAPEEGLVINQFPIPGSSAKRGDQVELEVGKVPEL
jgi:serine/threonine-protein kinase